MAPLAAIRMPAVPPARSSANLFSILEDERTLDDEADSRAARDRTYTSSSGTHSSDTRSSSESWSVLGDLPIDHCQSQAAPQHPTTDYSWSGFENVHRAELKSGKPQTNSRTPWRRRPQLESQTFEPLDSVREEASGLADSSCSEIRSRSPDAASGRHVQRHLPQDTHLAGHPLAIAESDQSIRQQIVKHLEGQFEYLVSYPALAYSAEHHGPSNGDDHGHSSGHVVFGCNLLSRKRPSTSKVQVGCRLADTYTLIATPLEGNAHTLTGSESPSALAEQVEMALVRPFMSYGTPLKVPDFVKDVNQAVSPSLSVASERSSVYVEGASPSAGFSGPRIEDSLEEIDRLEDQLEAVNAVAGPRRVASPDGKKSSNASRTLQSSKKPTAAKRVSIAGHFATVRIKPSERTRPTIRRSASMSLRDKDHEPLDIVPEQKAHASLSRSRSIINRLTEPSKPSVKSTKPPTVPNFELPGEAVARRLKEQREARQAQRAEAEKTYVGPPRPKSNKPLTKPTFELPGEAISRRKREEREAKLKAQEEEERKRREFKARPVRHSVVPSTLPRETVTSRARQARSSQDEPAPQHGGSRRGTAGLSRQSIGSSTPSLASQARGRVPTTASMSETSRATSASVGSASGKRSTLSHEDAVHLRLRGREIFERDSSFCHDKETERHDREMSTKQARDEAAERSRAASREWAEKKRRKEQALREAMQAAAQQASPR